MFNSGIKGNQRFNGNSPLLEQIVNERTHNQNNFKLNNSSQNDLFQDNNVIMRSMLCSKIKTENLDTKVKIEIEDELDFEDKITAHSIIGLSKENGKSHKNNIDIKSRHKSSSIRDTHHETLQRIEVEQNEYNHYQQHWFSASLEKFKIEDGSREERLEITRHEFRRHIQQIKRSNVGHPNKFPTQIKAKVRNILSNKNPYQIGYNKLVEPKGCEIEDCIQPALPCSKHCTMHIMYNTDQVLFDYCTAKFADNTQCSVPVFDITHELPLCPEHARKRDNYKLYQEAKPKKLRKKVKPSAMIRPQKRNKKKRRPTKTIETIDLVDTPDTTNSAILDDIQVSEEIEVGEINEINEMDEMIEITEVKCESPELEEELVEQVLVGLNESDGLEQAIAAQAHLLEETDISTVLSTIQVDEFSDFFAVNRNGEYEPSREEAEELEKALAAVDNDVKSLEKLSQSHGILDILDDHTLSESLVQIPEMFHNGYTPCGDSMVAQTSAYLLPVDSHSHS